MRVGINAQLLNTQPTYRSAGVSNYSAYLLRHLGALAMDPNADLSLTAFINAKNFEAPGIDLVSSGPHLQRPVVRILWEQSTFPGHLQRANVDLVHGLVNVLPLTPPIPGVVTVHDLSFVREPETLPRLKRAYLSRLCRASVHRARHVIAVSRQTADDLVRFFDVDAQKIEVIYNGVGSVFSPGEPAEIEDFRRQRGLPARFLLFLGTLEPRKNLEMLVRAYGRWHAQASSSDQAVKLVLAGGRGWYYDQIFSTVHALGLEDHVLFPGFVASDELVNWYRAAEGFVYPSRFEGFGLPLLEAMACGTPALCSRAGSLLEIAGDAAFTFALDDEDGLVAALGRLMSDEGLQRDLRRAGLAQASNFSWSRTAQETAGVYRRVYAG
jgi:glycosyltransferase involved in cell wall biosynthesis